MRKFNATIVLLHFVLGTSLYAQDNTILVFDPVSEQTDTIQPIAPTDTTAGFLPHGFGTLPGWEPLENVTSPEGYLGQAHQLPPRAAGDLDLTAYPVRAAGQLRRIEDDSTWARCSGQLVGPWHVLTASHCLREMFTGDWRTGRIDFFPVRDEGTPSIFGSARAVKYYVPLQWERDCALIELDHPMGEELGWIGLGFTTDSTYFDDRIVHKFSYPADGNSLNSDVPYNGDTLYHLSSSMVRNSIGAPPSIGVSGWTGIPGESGSGVWVTDNTLYQVLGVATWASGYRHTLMDAGTFQQFRTILEDPALGTSEPASTGDQVRVFPNPALDHVTIQLGDRSIEKHTLAVSDISGRLVATQEFNGPSCTLPRNRLASGIYIYRITGGNGTSATGRLFFE